MRVLMVIRPDARANYGGDTAQMEHTADALRVLGIPVETSTGPPTDEEVARADLVHLFNLQTPDFTLEQLTRAKEKGKKAALSTVWWDFAADEVLRTSRKWRALRSLLGTKNVRPILHKRMQEVRYESRTKHRAILQSADLLLPNSESEADQLRELTDFDARVVSVPNGVLVGGEEDEETAFRLLTEHRLATDRSSPVGEVGERVPASRFLFVCARVEPVKNQLDYIRAVKPLRVPVVCAGSLTQPYADECEKEGAVLLGRQEPSTVRALYRRAALHALPSLRETPGLASLEAAAAGCRVLSTDVGSARDYFGDLVLYCDPHSARSMRRATKRALATPADPRLAAHVATHFTWHRAAEETLRAYTSIL